MGVFTGELLKLYERASRRPWEASYGMVRVSPHSWYVGEEWVGVILVETGRGLVMLDSGINGQRPYIFEAVRKLGYDPEKDIRLCLLSHAHADHCSGMPLLQAYAKPQVWMSEPEKDWAARPEQYNDVPAAVDVLLPFRPDAFYDYASPIKHGGFSFTVLHTPGHTPGTSSFLYEDRDADGTVYRVGMHGGMGLNTLYDECFGSAGEAEEARRVYREANARLLEIPVDITISNHGQNIHMKEKLGKDKTDFRPFIDPGFWKRHIREKLDALDRLERESRFRKAGS